MLLKKDKEAQDNEMKEIKRQSLIRAKKSAHLNRDMEHDKKLKWPSPGDIKRTPEERKKETQWPSPRQLVRVDIHKTEKKRPQLIVIRHGGDKILEALQSLINHHHPPPLWLSCMSQNCDKIDQCNQKSIQAGIQEAQECLVTNGNGRKKESKEALSKLCSQDSK